MSRGLGREQKAIIWAIADAPSKHWSRMEIQQAVWGAQVRHMGLKRHPQHSRPHRNVAWWRTDPDGEKHQNYDSTFGRALRSLERRGLLQRHQEQWQEFPPKYSRPRWTLTAAGLAEAQKLAPDS